MAKKSSKKSKQKRPSAAAPAEGVQAPRPASGPPAAAPRRRAFKGPVLALALLGMAVAGYLSYTSWTESQAAFCEAGSGCDLVQGSRWGTLLGVPIAFWGFLTYAGLAWVALRVKRPAVAWQLAWLLAFTGLGISLYLTAISIWVIGATCPYCLGSLAILAALTVVLAWGNPGNIEGFRWPMWLVQTGAVAAVAVVVLHLHFSGVFDPAAGPEDPYLKALAIHLAGQQDTTFFGAYWCPNCTAQKDLFGSSAKRLPYHECSPNGRAGPSDAECVRRDVSRFPTWFIRGQRVIGVQTPRRLAAQSGFVWRGEPPAAR